MTRTERARLRTILFGGGAVALAVLGLLVDVLSLVTNFTPPHGWLAQGAYVVIIVLILLALVNLVAGRAKPRPGQGDARLTMLADQAEQQLIALGSDAGGMAAAEWFRANENALHTAVRGRGKPVPVGSVDHLARICDALDAWYTRELRGGALFELAEREAAVAEQSGRRDLEEVAAARAATAYRMLGDLDAANGRLGTSAGVAARGRTAAAMRARRQVEWALVHLARADRCTRRTDRKEEVRSARDRLDEAASLLPRADVDADLAVRIDLGLVCLYRHADDGRAEAGAVAEALEHLELAAARAHQAHNAGLQAHARELCGVAAWMQGNPWQADAWWHEARRLYADIDDRQGRGRCLQHLGSAALVRGDAATAVRLLEESITLRDRAGELAARYLAEARQRLRPVQPPAATSPPKPRPTPGALFRRLSRWLFRRWAAD